MPADYSPSRTLVFCCLLPPPCSLGLFSPTLPRAQPYLQPGDGPIVLVLAPTRELAVQIQAECIKVGWEEFFKVAN